MGTYKSKYSGVEIDQILNNAQSDHMDVADNKSQISGLNQALADTKKDLQHQINTLVLESGGDSNLEVVNARADTDSHMHGTLNDRLESDFNKKADKSTVVSLQSQVSTNTTKTVDLQSQIDSLVIEAGGDSNPEVVQARTDENGTTHETLKARIDSSVTDLKSDLKALADIPVIWTEDKYIRPSDGTEQTFSPTSSLKYYASNYIDVSQVNQLETYVIANVQPCFYNANKVFIGKVSTVTGNTRGVFAVPSNAKYIRYSKETLQSNHTNVDYSLYAVTNLYNTLNSIDERFKYGINSTGTSKTAPYDNLNTIPNNTMHTYTDFSDVLNAPNSKGGTILTFSTNTSDDYLGSVQILLGYDGVNFTRVCWYSTRTWSEWLEFSQFNTKNNKYITVNTENVDTYKDFNTVPVNTVVTYVDIISTNSPVSKVSGTLFTYSSSRTASSGITQLFVTKFGKQYARIKWGSSWSAWISNQFDETNNKYITVNSTNVDTYKDFNTVPVNSIVTYVDIYVTNWVNNQFSGTLFTYTSSSSISSGIVQIATTKGGKTYSRIKWGSSWSAWNTYNESSGSNIEYASLSMFEKFAVIGDSYASGEIYINGQGHDYYNLSWGQNIARMCGNTCVNLSVGGLTTKTWLLSEHGLAKLNSSDKQGLYFICLGLNDNGQITAGNYSLGTIEDCKEDYKTNPDTFYGNYGKIIGYVKAKSPNAKIIICTVTEGSTNDFATVNGAIPEIAEHFSLPLIDVKSDAFFTSEFFRNNLVSSHMTATGYSGYAKGMMRLFSKCVKENDDYFNDYVGITE